MRGAFLALAGVAILASACGHSTGGASHHPQHTTKPPDAFMADTSGHRVKMALGSSCWSAVHGDITAMGCGDSVGWSQYPHLPRIAADRGDEVTVVLGFTPTKAVEVDYGGHSTTIPASQQPTLTVPGRGILAVDASGARGDVSYGIRIVPRSR